MAPLISIKNIMKINRVLVFLFTFLAKALRLKSSRVVTRPRGVVHWIVRMGVISVGRVHRRHVAAARVVVAAHATGHIKDALRQLA
jgi:hypothetical protein